MRASSVEKRAGAPMPKSGAPRATSSAATLTELRYTVPGRPKTWKRTDGRNRYNTAEHKAAKRMHWEAFAAAKGGRPWDVAGAFGVSVCGYWPDAQTGDLDKLIGIVFDGLEGIAWKKDRQVRRMFEPIGIVADGSPERVEVVVRRLAVDPVQSRSRVGRARRKVG